PPLRASVSILAHALVTPPLHDDDTPSPSPHLHWLPAALPVFAQLAIQVVAPRPDAAVTLERNRVIVPSRNGDNTGQSAHLDRGRSLSPRAVAQLAKEVVAPRPDAAVIHERNRVKAPSRDCHNT